MRRGVLDRRNVLRGAGLGLSALALPPLDAMLDGNGVAYADGTPLPRRFGVWFWADGVKPALWFPREVGAGWTLTPHLEPFAKVKASIDVLSGFDLKIGGIVHHVGTAGMLSGAPYRFLGPGNVSTFAQPSVDVIAARALGGATRFRSLEIGVDRANWTGEGTTGYVLSHNGPNNVNPPIYQPAELFDRLFPTGGAAAGTTADPQASRRAALDLAARRSVLDAVTRDAADLRRRLGAADRIRLDQHLEGIRALEQRLKAPASATPSAAGPACAPSGARPPTFERSQHRAVNQAMADLLTIALACDMTRVFSFRFAMWHTTRFGDVPGATQDLHTYTHDERGDQPMVQRHVLFTMEQLAYLLEKLQAVPAGAGTLLDQCAILCTTECQEGLTHSTSNIPMIVAGRAGGALRTGLHVRGSRENTSKVHLTLLRAVGANVASFGAEGALATDVVPALLA